LAHLNEALQIGERTGERWLEAELHRHKGQLVLRQGQSEAAEELYRKALSLAAEQEAELWELHAAVSLARLRRDRGRSVRVAEPRTEIWSLPITADRTAMPGCRRRGDQISRFSQSARLPLLFDC
jgi:predicted ATPase